MKKRRNVLFLFLIGVTLSLSTLKFIPVKAESSEPALDVFAAMLIDAKTGQILYEENADDAFYASGLSKMMVEYLAFEKLNNGEINLMEESFTSNYVVALSEESWRETLLNINGMKPNYGRYDIDTILEFVTIPGSIDATIFLAEAISGEEHLFVDEMNAKAEEFGLTSKFYNTTGLSNKDLIDYLQRYNELVDNEKQVNIENLVLDIENINKLSARESAIIAYNLLKDYPEVIQYKHQDYASRSWLSEHKNAYNQNGMLYIDGISEPYPHAFEGIKGLSTGYTEIEETIYSSFVGYYEKDGKEFIFVIYDDIPASDNLVGSHIEDYCFDSHNFELNEDEDNFSTLLKHKKYYESEKLLNYALGLEKVTITNENFGDYTEFGDSYDVYKGKSDKVKLEITEPIEFYLRDGEEVSVVVEFNDKLVNDDNKIIGPIKKDVEVGTLTIKINDKNFNTILSNDQTISTNLKTIEDIGRPNIFVLIWINTKELANDFIDWIKYVF